MPYLGLVLPQAPFFSVNVIFLRRTLSRWKSKVIAFVLQVFATKIFLIFINAFFLGILENFLGVWRLKPGGWWLVQGSH